MESKNTKKSIWSKLSNLSQRASIALMATIISTCALLVSLYQANLARKSQLASVWPYLSIGGYGTANKGDQTWGIRLANNGLGPAIIEKIEVKYHGKTYEFQVFMDTLYMNNASLDSLSTLNYAINSIAKGTVLPAGANESWFSFDMKFNNHVPKKAASEIFLNRIELMVQYKSLYGERWISCFNCSGGSDNEVRKLN
ncbi:MAG: hypothetical protein JNJ57_09800 [Saprospiraceae bacterium]|nr:hypothetical protein [Saprospiraceae bacterium]